MYSNRLECALELQWSATLSLGGIYIIINNVMAISSVLEFMNETLMPEHFMLILVDHSPFALGFVRVTDEENSPFLDSKIKRFRPFECHTQLLFRVKVWIIEYSYPQSDIASVENTLITFFFISFIDIKLGDLESRPPLTNIFSMSL